MQRKEIFIGIDVSKEWLDVAIYSKKEHTRILNSSQGFKQLQSWLKAASIDLTDCWIVFEYTGGYEYKLVQFCLSKHLTFTRVPGLEIKKSLGMQRGKNDKIDAYRISNYGYEKKDKLIPQTASPAGITELRQLLTQRRAFVKEKKANEHRLNELLSMMDFKKTDPVIKYYRQAIGHATKMIDKVQAAIMTVITSHQNIHRNFILISSVVGIGNVNAWMTIAYTENFQCFKDGRQYGAYCGIVPYDHSSGKSIKSRSRISHMANKAVKGDLDMAARAAAMHDPEIKAYYQRRALLGKHHMSIMNEIKFKLVLRMFAVVNKQEVYVKKLKSAA
jgi:transposase